MNADLILDSINDVRNDFILEAETPVRKRHALRRLAAAAIAAVLCLALAVPAVASSPIGYSIMYTISPALAQSLKPVNQSCEENDIRMEVISAVIEDSAAYIQIGLTGLEDGLLDGSTDLNDSYYVNYSFDAAASCSKLDYDDETNTITYLIRLSPMGDEKLTGGKVTFGLRELCGFTADWEGPLEDVALTPSDETVPGPVEHAAITCVDFVDDKLHVEVYFDPIDAGGANGFLYLKDENGEPIYGESDSRHDEAGTGRYDDYTFDVTPDQAESCALWGWFYTMSEPIEGPWSVTFPLEPADG